MSEKIKGKIQIIGSIVGIVIIVIIIKSVFLNNNSTKNSSALQDSKNKVSDEIIISCARTEVGRILKSVSTANWGTSEIVDKDNYGRYLVYVPLEAQNGFGAYNKLYYLVIVKDVDQEGNYKAMTYNSRLEIPNYMGASTPSIISDYKNGETAKILKDFLENNNWGQEESQN